MLLLNSSLLLVVRAYPIQKPRPKKQSQCALRWNSECDRALRLRKVAEQKAHQYPCDANIIAYQTG